MATNVRQFMSTTKASPLNIEDIEPADKLIYVRWAGHHTIRTELEVTVVKVLKTRLVVMLPNGREERVLVEAGKYAYSSLGNVTTRTEGQSEWNRDAFELYTPDEPLLITSRADFEAKEAGRKARMDADNAINKFSNGHNVENAQAAIVALQKWIALNA